MGIIRLPPFKVNRVVTSLSSQITPWGLKENKIPETWKTTRGEGITVMIIDTGFSNHKDLKQCVDEDRSRSFITEEPYIGDENGHSTHCSGIVGARDNDFGMVGVAPESKIITCKVLSKEGFGSDESINMALKYAVEIKPDIVSMSLGGPVGDPDTHRLIKKLYEMNIPVIAAAGNEGRDGMGYPALFPETIAIAAYDRQGNIANFSSVGEEVDFAAPGVDIYSTWLDNTYASLQGTSMATPFMAGVVALLLAKHKKQEKETGQNDCKTVEQIREHLLKYTIDKGIIGKDENWGYGVIDVSKLISEQSVDQPVIIPPKKKKSFWEKFKEFFGF